MDWHPVQWEQKYSQSFNYQLLDKKKHQPDESYWLRTDLTLNSLNLAQRRCYVPTRVCQEILFLKLSFWGWKPIDISLIYL